MLDEVVKALVELILRARTVETDEVLATVVSNIVRDTTSTLTGSTPSGT